MQKKYLPVNPSKRRAFMLLGATLFLYLLDNLTISSIIDYKVYSNIIKPILWLSLAGIVWVLPRVRSRAPLKLRESLYWWAFTFAVIYIIVSVIAGLIDGFGRSPYDHSLKGILVNITVVGTMLVGREAVRSYSVNSLTKYENFMIFIPIAFLMTVSNYKIGKFIELKSIKDIVIFVAQLMIPEFLQNLMATYLAFLGGWFPALIYMGIIYGFHWFSPILPNLQWITAALVGIMCTFFSLTAMQGIYLKEARLVKNTEKDKEDLAGWIVTTLLSIGIIWFSVGVFPIYPSVIATGSMEPMIKPGDVILVEKMLKVEDLEQLKEGDVIQFDSDNILISHRIIKILEEDGVKVYRTKGDNNSVPDGDPVKPGQIRGKIVQVVPKIGWPTLLLKSKEDIPLDKVEF